MFSLNCLPPLLALYLVQCVLKHLCTRLTTLTSSFLLSPNHKITVALTGQLAVGIHTLDCKYTFLSFLKKLAALTTGMEEGLWGGGGEVCK